MGCCRSYGFWYVVLSCFVYSLNYFFRNSISAITDALQKDLNTDASGIGLLSSSLYATYFGMQLIIGLLLEIYSYQLLLYLGSFGLGVTSLLFGLSNSVVYGTIIRAVAGVMVAPLFLTGISIGAQRFGNRYVGLITGLLLFSSQTMFSGVVTFQAWLYNNYDIWREVYYVLGIVSLFISFLVGIMAIMELKETMERTIERIPKKAAVDAKTQLLPISRNNQSNFTQSLIYRSRVNIGDESVSKVKRMLHSLKKSMLNITNWFLGLQQFSLRSITYALNGLWIIAYLRLKFNYSPSLAAFISGVFFISSGIGSIFSGKMLHTFNKRKIFLIIGVVLSQFACIIIYVIPESHASFSTRAGFLYLVIVIVCNSISGFGCGFLPVGFTMAREHNEKYQCSDTATGMVNMIGSGAGFISQLVVSNLIDIHWEGGLDENTGEKIYTVEDYNFAFLLIPATGVIGFIMSVIVKEPDIIRSSFVSLSSFTRSKLPLPEEKIETDQLDDSSKNSKTPSHTEMTK